MNGGAGEGRSSLHGANQDESIVELHCEGGPNTPRRRRRQLHAPCRRNLGAVRVSARDAVCGCLRAHAACTRAYLICVPMMNAHTRRERVWALHVWHGRRDMRTRPQRATYLGTTVPHHADLFTLPPDPPPSRGTLRQLSRQHDVLPFMPAPPPLSLATPPPFFPALQLPLTPALASAVVRPPAELALSSVPPGLPSPPPTDPSNIQVLYTP